MKRAWLIAGSLVCAGVAGAVDAPPSDALPDLAPARALLYSDQFAEAEAELSRIAETTHHADVYNLLGYANRKLGRYDEAAKWYGQALYHAPDHRPALEYQGELFIETGALDRARENVKLLEIFCPTGCAELDSLRASLAGADKAGS